MIWLLLSIISSVSIFIAFKLFGKYSINNLPAITINYATAYCIGLFVNQNFVNPLNLTQKPWFIGALILGFSFISLFLIMALSSQKLGVSTTSIAVKTSLIFPVIFGVYYYSELLTWHQIIGIILAFSSIFLSSSLPSHKSVSDKSIWLLPFILFIGCGFLDTFINFSQKQWVPHNEKALYISSIFGVASLIGIIAILYKFAIKQHFTISSKDILGGIGLGIVNFGSIYFLVKALVNLENSSIVFPMLNMGILVLSVLIGTIFFKEALSRTNVWGVILAFLAIIFMSL